MSEKAAHGLNKHLKDHQEAWRTTARDHSLGPWKQNIKKYG